MKVSQRKLNRIILEETKQVLTEVDLEKLMKVYCKSSGEINAAITTQKSTEELAAYIEGRLKLANKVPFLLRFLNSELRKTYKFKDTNDDLRSTAIRMATIIKHEETKLGGVSGSPTFVLNLLARFLC
tara:strand:- start:580 stop:963 length:384 start_codon:yes stop_codon:yes gene_type:complete